MRASDLPALSAAVRDLRMARGLSVKQVAQRSESDEIYERLGQSSIRAVESGRLLPRDHTLLVRLSRALTVPPAALVAIYDHAAHGTEYPLSDLEPPEAREVLEALVQMEKARRRLHSVLMHYRRDG